MSVYESSELRKGMKIKMDGAPFLIVESQFVKPGKGQAFTRTKMRNMITGSIYERTFKQGEKFDKADLDERQMQYQYIEGDFYVFMDTTNYEQERVSAEQLGENKYYLLDNTLVDILFYDGKAIGITPPIFVELRISETEPGFKGDTSSNVQKPAKVETGLEISVPLFVNEGDIVRIDTRTGEYAERVTTKK